MKELKKHELDFERSLIYIQRNLKEGKTLSLELINIANFTTGCFFTLLPSNADTEKLYDFEAGGILPQNPEQKYFSSGEKTTYSIIPTIQNEISEFILHRAKENKKLACVFEEILDSPSSPQLDFFSQHCLLRTYHDDVYYLIKNPIDKLDLISKCIEKSNAIWHSLCVLTTTDFTDQNEIKWHLEKIENICLNANLIMIGAYDGEGYIFWEKRIKV